jgi:hypothetical protein
MRHDDHSAQTIQLCGKGDGLPMIARRRGDHTAHLGLLAFQLVHIDQPAANFKSPDRRVVFMLQPQIAALARFEQRPAVRWCFVDVGTNERLGGFDFAEGRQWLHLSPLGMNFAKASPQPTL